MIVNGSESDHTALITPLSPQYEPTHIQTNSSQNPPSFESILSGTSVTPYSRVAFSNYLKKVHCSENLDFLLSSNQYLILISEQNSESSYESRQLWFFIYTNYISSDSLKEVNIPHSLREELTEHFVNDTLPNINLIERTMISIKDLLRDAYLQFIRSASKEQACYFDKINENYSLLPSLAAEINSPSTKSQQHKLFNQRLNNRRNSDGLSPLEGSDHAAPVSQLSESEGTFHPKSRQPSLVKNDIPRSTEDRNFEYATSSHSSDLDFNEAAKNNIQNRTKNSISEASNGLKKFAGKLRWRRLSSNSSTSSN